MHTIQNSQSIPLPTQATKQLDQLGIPYQIFQHNGSIHSLEQVAEERKQQTDQVVRSIVFRIANSSYIMVIIAGPFQISWQSLRKYLNLSRITMASPDEVRSITGYTPGTVSPLGLPKPIPILVDKHILSQKEISIGSGERGVAIIMKVDNLLKALGKYEFGDFCSECD